MEGQDKGNVNRFIHSVKVPRLYKQAAKVAKEASEGLGSLKNLVYEAKHPNIKAAYALVATLYKHQSELDNLLKRTQFFTKEPRADPWLSKILLVELLWGKKRLPGQSRPENTIRAYEQIFKAHLSDVKSIKTDLNTTKVDTKPRYVRVNTLKITLNDAIEKFCDDGWTLVKFLEKNNYTEFLNRIISLEENEFMVDIHIPNLLIFPSGTTFYNHPAYKNGSIILQDKASCLPVHILNPPPGSVVLDMCAAPGMKTTHLAAVMNSEGTVFAVERNPKRFETLNRILDGSGATCVQTFNKDVLTCSSKDFPNVEYILVDPSCTGSGMTDYIAAKQGEDSRNFEKITGFQIMILRSALTRYPEAKRVIYSTCSIYPEENEDVVRQVLETNYKYKLVPAGQFVNNTWKNFGSPDFGDIGKFCLYAKPHEDFTNGFFIAVFEKLEEGEENQFFNNRIFNYKKDVSIKEKKKKRREEKDKIFADVEFTKNNNNHGKKNKNVIEHMKIKEYNYERNPPQNDIDSTSQNDETVTIAPRIGKKKKSNLGNSTENSVNVTENSNEILEHISQTNSNETKRAKSKKKHEINTSVLESTLIPFDNDLQNDDDHLQDTRKKTKKKQKPNFTNETSPTVSEVFPKLDNELSERKINKNKDKKKDVIDNFNQVEDIQEPLDKYALETETHTPVKEKKKKHKSDSTEESLNISENGIINGSIKKNKKKNREKCIATETNEESFDTTEVDLLQVKEKRRNHKSEYEGNDPVSEEVSEETSSYNAQEHTKKKKYKTDNYIDEKETNGVANRKSKNKSGSKSNTQIADEEIEKWETQREESIPVVRKKHKSIENSDHTEHFMTALNSFSMCNNAAKEEKKKKRKTISTEKEDIREDFKTKKIKKSELK